MFMHDFNGQLTGDRMRRFETEAARHRLGKHAQAVEVTHVPSPLLHSLLAVAAAAGAVSLQVTQTAPYLRW
jgi:hypothetical protein